MYPMTKGQAYRAFLKRPKIRPARPLSSAAKLALSYIGDDWGKVPHCIKASHIAVLIRQGHIEHRWPSDILTRMATGSVPWLREGEIRRRPNTNDQAGEASPATNC